METTLFEKHLIVDVFDVFFYDENNRLIFMSKNLTSASISNSQDSVEVRNGKGNGLFSVLSTNKSVEVSVTENVFNFKNLSLLTGSEIVTGSGEAYCTMEEYIVDGLGQIVLEEVPIYSNKLQIEANGKFITDYVANGQEVTFPTGVSEGDSVLVYPYLYESPEESETLVVNANIFPKGGTLVMQTFEVDARGNRVADFSIILPKVVPTGEWSIETQSEVQPTDTSIVMKALQYNNKGDLYYIHRRPYKSNQGGGGSNPMPVNQNLLLTDDGKILTTETGARLQYN